MPNDTDLAQLRDIAESGRRAPLLGGRFFLWWGGLATVALLAHWYVITGQAGIELSMVGFVWLVFGILGGIGSSILGKTLARKPGLGAISNRSERAVWSAVTFAITAYVAGVLIANVVNRFDVDRLILFDTIPIFAFACYGISFAVTAALGGPGWMRVLAPIAWVGSGAGLYWVGTPHMYLYAAALAITLAVLPGLALLRQEPASETSGDE